MFRSPADSTSEVRRRAALLNVWRLTPDASLRRAIELELYGAVDPGRAREEAERFTPLSLGARS